MDYKKLGDAIRNRRIFLNETQDNVAKNAHVSNTFISNIENIKADNIDLKKLYAICVYLKMDIFMLIEEALSID